MHAISGIFRMTSYLLTFLILCQSCTIYRSTNISLDEAIETENKVRVKTTSETKYAFKRIERGEDIIYGIAGKNSKAGKELAQYILSENFSDSKVKIRLDEIPIHEINPKNKTLSVLVPLITAGVGLLIFGLTYEMGPVFGSGTF
jgi:hypothetical protein